MASALSAVLLVCVLCYSVHGQFEIVQRSFLPASLSLHTLDQGQDQEAVDVWPREVGSAEAWGRVLRQWQQQDPMEKRARRQDAVIKSRGESWPRQIMFAHNVLSVTTLRMTISTWH